MWMLLACSAAAVLAWFAPVEMVDPAARLLVVSTALMATGVFPCMTLVVNAMKGEQRTPALVEELHWQLHKLLKVLVVAFCLAVANVLLLTVLVSVISADFSHMVDRSITAASAVVMTLFAGRVAAIGRAFFALLAINRKQALLIARGEVQNERDGKLAFARANRLPSVAVKERALKKVG